MRIPSRRALSTILAAGLLLGSAPPEVQAQVARIAAGETGRLPVSPAAGAAAATRMAPALNLGAASLHGGLSAPPIAPSPVNTAPAAAPVLSQPLSAAADNAPKPLDVPKAASPAPVANKSWGRRIAALIGRKPASSMPPANETPSVEAAKAGANRAFDGAAEKADDVQGPSVSGGQDALHLPAGLAMPPAGSRVNETPSERAARVDEFGGPLAEPMNFKQRVGYGLKQGINLVGIGAIFHATVKPLLDLIPWPLYLSNTALEGIGRVALLAKFGPGEIVSNLSDSPAAFLGVALPMAVTMEELTYRLLGFGLTFLTLATVKPVARRLSTLTEGLPDAAGAAGGARLALNIGGVISHFAFPIAAAASSIAFAIAHFATWGYSPFIFVLNASLGLFLAHTAYVSRSLTSPLLAHLLFNLVAVGGIMIAMSYSPFAGAAFTTIAGLIGAASLLYGYLSARKERAFRLKNGTKALAALMIVSAGLSISQGVLNDYDRMASPAAVRSATMRAAVHPAAAAPAASPAPTADDSKTEPAPVESRADMVARVKPAIVNVIVYVPGGYTIGSGFILTPEGVFVTNGHVVGGKKPGEKINANVPGIEGELSAKVLAVNHDKDLAIVQLQPRPDGRPWPTVKLATKAPREGETVTAIGYPRGLGFSVSQGVVSGVDGRDSMYVRKLQTDTAINPGNSGGPLFNDRGEVVGVNTEIRTESGGSEGLGFSIQAAEVERVMAQFAKTGNIATASLGIIADISDPRAPEAGLAIEQVRPGSAAAKAGLRRGDLLVAIDGEEIEEGGAEAADHVATALAKSVPGQKMTITVLRGDAPVKLELTVDAKATAAPKD